MLCSPDRQLGLHAFHGWMGLWPQDWSARNTCYHHLRSSPICSCWLCQELHWLPALALHQPGHVLTGSAAHESHAAPAAISCHGCCVGSASELKRPDCSRVVELKQMTSKVFCHRRPHSCRSSSARQSVAQVNSGWKLCSLTLLLGTRASLAVSISMYLWLVSIAVSRFADHTNALAGTGEV